MLLPLSSLYAEELNKSVYFENSEIAVICFRKYPVTDFLKILQNIICHTIVLVCFLWQVIKKSWERRIQSIEKHCYAKPASSSFFWFLRKKSGYVTGALKIQSNSKQIREDLTLYYSASHF